MYPTLARTPAPLALLAGLCLLMGLASPPVAAQEPALVGVDAVREEPYTQTVEVIGRLVSRRAGVVSARTRGPVDDMRVDVGDRVEQGDIIAVLVTDRPGSERDLRAAEVAAAEASLATASAEVRLKRQELARLEGLRKSPAFSKGSYDDKFQEVAIAESRLAEARAALARDRSQLRLAEISLDDAEIRAPYAGVVTQRHTEVGSHVDIGAPVVSLVDDQSLEVEADVPAEKTGGLIAGTRVTIALGDRQIPATVRAVVPEENTRTRTRTVRFAPEFGNLANLAANQSVIVRLPAGASRNVVTVHKDAILNRKGRTLAVVVADGTTEIRPVRLGDAVGNRFEVLDALKPGDVVVVRGNERLRPGQKVRSQQDAEAPAGTNAQVGTKG